MLAVAWCVAGMAAVFLVAGHLQHKLWIWRGNRLSAQFDELLRFREQFVDPIVSDPTVSDDDKRHAVESYFEMLDELQRARAEWTRALP